MTLLADAMLFTLRKDLRNPLRFLRLARRALRHTVSPQAERFLAQAAEQVAWVCRDWENLLDPLTAVPASLQPLVDFACRWCRETRSGPKGTLWHHLRRVAREG